jgi:hypothetical protein
MMHIDVLFATLSALTKLKSPRDLKEFDALKTDWPKGFPEIEDGLVDEVLRHLCEADPVPRWALIERMTTMLPFDIVMILNQALIKRPAFVALTKELYDAYSKKAE